MSLNLLQYYPAPNATGTANNLATTASNKDNIDQFLGRVDQNIGNKIRLYVRYNWHDSLNTSIGAIPATGVTQPRVNKNTLFTYTHTLKPNLFNDFRIGYHRLDFNTLNQFLVNDQAGVRHGARHPRIRRRHEIQQSRPPERQRQHLQRPRRRRHELVPVRHDVPGIGRPGLEPRLA